MRRFVVAVLAAPFLIVPFSSPAAAACARVPSDFNGDGYGDVAIGAPRAHDPVYDVNWQGVVHVAYGSAAGVGKGAQANASFRGSTAGLPRFRFTGSERLGESLASGYFDGDCYADLAVSAASGSDMLVLYGSAAGLTVDRSAGFDRTAIQPEGEYGSGFSSDITTGDFDGDGFDDIAAGAPWTDANAGAFGVLYGSATGITNAGAQWIDQDSASVPGAAEADDGFGTALAAGDFNGDGRDDLAVGAPGEALGTLYGAGGLIVFPGTAAGLGTAGSTWWDQDSAGVPGGAEYLDRFGVSLTAGDTTGDGREELFVGVPSESIGTKDSAGMLQIFRGAASGLVAGSAYNQDDAQIPGDAEAGDQFGGSLGLADLNRDGRLDLAVGAPGEWAGTVDGNGAINVLFSTTAGPTPAGSVYIDQNSAGVPGDNEDLDAFGWSLGRVANAYGGDTLSVSANDEKVTYSREGAVTLLPGAPAGQARPAGYFFSGANFPAGAAAEANFGAGLS
ncbi:FG-GAP repeat protein [Actinoplanes sp. RD1]|uniref:FG-GAP repeat protein n=1 Tax=Actinoplanes sp. RD1 TaxID=3064538 RepID=UPI0027426518|nr:FG-GAP repeat protein [Actinoplanes sp. RD1]